jgi:1-deoxyxylulose-5-phosphate synthase
MTAAGGVMKTVTRPLGRSGLALSVLGLGTATFGREVPAAAAARLVHAFLDHGLSFIDTADSYAGGAAEEVIGMALRRRRDEAVLSTKAGLPLHPGPERGRSSRRHLLRALDGSLRRLRTDHVDLFHLHRWDDQTPVEESLSALQAMIAAGKVRYAAVSNFTGWQLAWTAQAGPRHGCEPLVAVQARYSLGSRDAEREILPYCRWSGLGFVAFAPLAGGILSDKYSAGAPYPAGSRGADPAAGASLRRRLTPALQDVTERLRELAPAAGATPAQLALAWLLSRRGVTSAVAGVTSQRQLAENIAATSLVIDPAVLAQLDAAAAAPRGYPQDLLRELGCAGPETTS